MALGGFNPYPRRMGGGKPRVQVVLESLAAGRGDAYDGVNRETTVYVENMALARAVSAAWGTNERLSHCWDPARCGEDILARWEKILGLPSLHSLSSSERRARVAALNRFQHQARNGDLVELLENNLGDAFVAIEYIPYALAQITVPDGSYPWGTASVTKPWSSSVAHILVRLQKPAGWTEGQFYQAASRVFSLLDPIMPAWATFTWYRAGDVSSSTPGGPSAAGFYLDNPHNLDNQILGS